MIRSLGWLGDQKSESNIVNALKKGHPGAAEIGVRVLTNWQKAGATDGCKEVLTGRAKGPKADCLVYLGQIKEASALPLILRYKDSKEKFRALGYFVGNDEAKKGIQDAAKSAKAGTWIAASTWVALSNFGDADAWKSIDAWLLKDKNERNKETLVEELVYVQHSDYAKKAKDLLAKTAKKYLEMGDTSLRYIGMYAAATLARMGDSRGDEWVQKVLNHQDSGLREKMLGMLSGEHSNNKIYVTAKSSGITKALQDFITIESDRKLRKRAVLTLTEIRANNAVK